MNVFQLLLLINLLLLILLFVKGVLKIKSKGYNPIGKKEPTKNIFGIFSIILSTLLLLFLWIYYVIDTDISKHFFAFNIITHIIFIKWTALAIIIGATIVDEKKLGTAHIAIGSNYWFGGPIRTIIHLDQIMKDVTIEVDGEKLRI